MKIKIFFLSSLMLATVVCAQKSYDYQERLFYTCKVWGFLKYFHSETANCILNIDSLLIQKLPQIEAATNNTEFNQVLLGLISSLGPTALPTIPPPVIPDSLRYNLDFNWIQNPVFSQQVRSSLDTIRVRFRPRPHCLVGEAFYNGNPAFENDTLYNSGSELLPDKPLRILSLFRYWNILNYFFPYKNIMDQAWDTTLTEVLPLFIDASTPVEYNKAVMVLAKRIDDSHAFINGGAINSILGINYPRFSIALVENETVVTKVYQSVNTIMPGDIVRSIDGIEIGTLRDSLESYTHGSNPKAVASFVYDDILLGPYGIFPIVVENQTGIHSYNLQRNWSGGQFAAFQQNTGPVWYDSTIYKGCHFGYVDLGRLTIDQVGTMMNDLWDTDAIIFDLRNYPQSTLWYLVNYLFTQPFQIASFTTPNFQYPGVLFWQNVSIGSYTSNVYQGQLIILFDIRTLSQAEYTCMGLEQHPESVKIGNQTKGADGNVSTIYLPGNLTTFFTGLGTFYPDYTPTQRVGIIPDIEIWPTIQGIRQGRDEILEYAMNCNILSTTKDHQVKEEISILPNPFRDKVRIECSLPDRDQVVLEFMDMRGRLITRQEIICNGSKIQTVEINTSKWNEGFYYCMLKSGSKISFQKLIKLR